MKALPFILLMASLSLPGCSSLRPYAEVADSLPSDDLLTIGNQRVHVQRWGETGAPLVLLHGFAASTYSFRELGPLLGTSHRVLALDYNGHGYTERPKDPAAYTLDGQLALITATLDELGIERASFVGHSFGGQLALHLAARHPGRVDGLVLVSPPTDLDRAPWPLRFAVVRRALYPLVRLALSSPARFRKLLRNAYHRDGVLTAEVAEGYRRRLLVEGFGAAYFGFGKAMVAGGGEPPVPVRPVLLVGGRHDAVVPIGELEAFAASLPGAHLEILEGSGHSAPEEEPRELQQLIEAHLPAPR